MKSVNFRIHFQMSTKEEITGIEKRRSFQKINLIYSTSWSLIEGITIQFHCTRRVHQQLFTISLLLRMFVCLQRELPSLLPPTIPLTEKHHHHQYTLTLLVGSTRSMTSFFSSFQVCSCRLGIGPFTAPTPPIICFIYCSSRASQHCHEH